MRTTLSIQPLLHGCSILAEIPGVCPGYMPPKRTASKSMPRKNKGSASGASSSGDVKASDSQDSRSTSPKERVGNYHLDDLPALWDGSAFIRERIREGHNILTNFDQDSKKVVADLSVDGTYQNVHNNAPILKPILEIMKSNSLMMPSIDRLIHSLDVFYKIAKRPQCLESSYREAWSIRRLLYKCKSFMYRKQCPQDWY